MVEERVRDVHARQHTRAAAFVLDPLEGFRYDRSMRSLTAIRRTLRGAAFGVGLACAGCGLGTLQAPNIAEPGLGPNCKQAKDPLHPLIVEWSAANKVALDSASRRGVVVVSLDGCSLRIVSGCQASGTYDAVSTKPERHSLELKDRNDLFAFLPLAAPRLGGSFSSGKSLLLDYVTVGERAIATESVALTGDCAGATHFAKRVYLGAYSLDSRADAKATRAGRHARRRRA